MRRREGRAFLLSGLLIALGCGCSSPREPEPSASLDLVLHQGQDVFQIAATQYLEDPSRKISFEEISGQSPAPEWKRKSDTNFGYSMSRFWLRFSIRNQSSATREWVLEHGYPLIQNLEVHVVDDTGVHLKFVTGKRYRFAERPIKHRKFLFPFTLEEGHSASVYMAMESTGTLRAPLRVLSAAGVATSTSNETVALGIYFGVVLALIIYNFFIYLTIRDTSYLFYILYTSSFALAQACLSGFAYQYLWPTLVGWNQICVPLLIGLSFLLLGQFSRLFLSSKALAPMLDKLLLILCLLSAGLVLMSVVHYGILANKMASWLATYIPLLVLPVAVACAKRGSRSAWFYLLGFLAFFAGSTCVAMKDLGLVPISFWTTYGMHLGSAAEALLFSLGLADRIRILKDEKLRFQIEALENSRVLAEHERAFERQEALAAMAAQVSHDIRSPLAALDVAIAHTKSLPEESRVFIRSAVNRIRDIANSLLAYSREDAARGQSADTTAYDRTTVLLPALLDALVTEKRIQYRNRIGLELLLDLTPEAYGLFAQVQPTDFRRAISNLIDNAIEAIPDSGTVRISLFRQAGFGGIQVDDSGVGIPPDVLPRLGHRGQTYGKRTGSGLGLHYARTCIETWGGHLKLSSAVNCGTSVLVRLPLVDTPPWFAATLDIASHSTVVILDDDASIHRIWAERLDDPLRKAGNYRLVHFSSPRDLVERISTVLDKEGRVLFLIDHEFLGDHLDGLKLIEQLGIASQSILVTSRFDEAPIRVRCEKLGVPLIPKGLAGLVPIIIEATPPAQAADRFRSSPTPSAIRDPAL